MGGKQAVKWVQLTFGLAVVVIVVGGLWAAVQAQSSGAPQGGGIPVGQMVADDGAASAQLIVTDKFGAMRLVSSQRGREAVAQINSLHGTDVGVDDGYIASYQGGGNQAILWMARTASPTEAKRLTALMTEKIKAGNATFTGFQEFQKEGKTIYTVVGQGQKHYYYQTSAKVVWLGVSGPDPEDILQRVLLYIG